MTEEEIGEIIELECPLCKGSGVSDVEHSHNCSGWESGDCDCNGVPVQCDCHGLKYHTLFKAHKLALVEAEISAFISGCSEDICYEKRWKYKELMEELSQLKKEMEL